MYPTVVSPPNSMHPTAPASPRMAQPSSYSLPPSNREARLLAQPKAQSHTVAPGGIVPTSKNSNKQKEKGFSLQKSPQKTLTKEESAKMIQQTFKKSPGFKKFNRQKEVRKKYEEFYKENGSGSGSKSSATSDLGDNSDSYDSENDDRRKLRSNRRRGNKKSRRFRDYSDDDDLSDDSDYSSEDSSDSYADSKRRRGSNRGSRRHRSRSRSRNRKKKDRRKYDNRRRSGRRRRDDSDSDQYSESSDDNSRNTKKRDRRRGKEERHARKGKGKGKGKGEGKASNSKKEVILSHEDKMTQAAVKIQAFVRGRQTYFVWENTTYPYLIRWRQQTLVVTDALIAELLEDEVIPDVLIEIFSHAGDAEDPFAPNPEVDRLVWSVWIEIVNEVVADLGDGLSRQVIHTYVNGYLQTRREQAQASPDPVTVVVEDLSGEVADDTIKKVVGECITEMVQAYLRQQTADEFLNTTLQPLIAEVVHLTMDDLEVENIVEDMVEEYILKTSQEVAAESFLEMQDIILGERQRRQYSEVATAAQRIFDNASLRMLIRTMATNAESILMRDYMNRLASGMLVRTIFTKLQRVQQHDNEMTHNRPMRHFHQEITSRIAIRQMLSLLPEQLDKDESEIDDREDLDGFSLDEEQEKAAVAVRIQARYRGRAQRIASKKLEEKKQEEAALVIQARLRGRSVRKAMKDEQEMQQKLYGH